MPLGEVFKNMANEERLQKALARAGIASRRACEELIAAGRVRVNGKIVTELGTKIDASRDKITVDDHPVSVKPAESPRRYYIMLNKPAGYLSTVTDPQGRPTVMDLIDVDERLYPIGRLDVDTTGLLLLTNDGAFAQALSHPRFQVEKEYLVLVQGRPPLRELEKLRKGVAIPVEDPDTGETAEYITKPAKVELVGYEESNSLLRFVITEGKKRQIRLMVRTINHRILELQRVRYGPIRLGELEEGKTRNLTKLEIKMLLEAANAERPENKIGPGKAGPRSVVRDGKKPAPAASTIQAGTADRSKPVRKGGKPGSKEPVYGVTPSGLKYRKQESSRPEPKNVKRTPQRGGTAGTTQKSGPKRPPVAPRQGPNRGKSAKQK
jgi:23S rRNA pseudouridine2605 synthase/16S rRNA pseudouridine516 synthase